MTYLKVPVDEYEAERLVDCAREPIRTPSAVQPHGVLITADARLRTLTRVSANSGTHFGVEPRHLLGAGLARLVGPDAVMAIRAVLEGSQSVANPVAVNIAGQAFDAIAHGVADEALVEFEPARDPALFSTSAAVYASILRLDSIRARDELWRSTAQEVRALTGFDRVVVYHFHPDGHGEVVAEQCADGMEPYIGLHFPASDVPAQARDLYLTKISRTIFSSRSGTAPLLATPDAPAALDLSRSELRSVSPHHLEFMRNMGQESTLSLSLIQRGELVGMITCAHRTPRRLPYALRQGLEVLANNVSLHLGAMAEIARLTRGLDQNELRARLTDTLADTDDIADRLLGRSPSIRDLIPCDAAAVSVEGAITVAGDLVTSDEVARFVAHLGETTTPLPFVANALAVDHPRLAATVPGVAGALIVPYGQGDFLACFRGEVAQTISWLGDQSAANRATPLSPRNSFSAWRQQVAGQAVPWDDYVLDGVDLGHDLDRALMRRAESRLAVLSLYDALTGLPNRRLLTMRLNEAFERNAGADGPALLFIDLDKFKDVNDRFGHEGGDALLVEAAARIHRATRDADTVARIGGDEFVVLCDSTTAQEAALIADRIVQAFREPFRIGDTAWAVTASVGITTAEEAASSTELLRLADESMYRAKRAGRNRVSD